MPDLEPRIDPHDLVLPTKRDHYPPLWVQVAAPVRGVSWVPKWVAEEYRAGTMRKMDVHLHSRWAFEALLDLLVLEENAPIEHRPVRKGD